MRIAAFAAVLAFALPLAADITIVPIHAGIVFGSDGSYTSLTTITNLGTEPVIVRRGEVYPVFLSGPCAGSEGIRLQAQQSTGAPVSCLGLFAYTLEHEGPIRVDSHVMTSRLIPSPLGGFTSDRYYQRIETARDWLPANREAIIPAVPLASRTNVFITNPNDFVIVVDMTVKRRSPREPERTEHHFVQPKSTTIFGLTGIDDPVCVLPTVCESSYTLTFTANGRYYASASAIEQFLDARFYGPTVLED